MNTTAYKQIAGRVRRLGTRRKHGLLVTDGWVNCPRRSLEDVDVEACYICPFLKDIVVDDAGSSWIHCRSDVPRVF